MKRQKKRLLGFLGLLLVATMTFVAAIIPGPETSAITGITDTIQVRVVGSVPNAKFADPSQNLATTSSLRSVLITHENVDSARIELTHKREDSTVSIYNFVSYDNLNYEAGEKTNEIDFKDYGYGEFVFSLYGVGPEGSEVEYDKVLVKYTPIITGPVVQNDDGTVTTKLEEFNDEDVNSVEIYIGDELIEVIPREALDDEIQIPMDKYDPDVYDIVFVAKNSYGEQLYLPEHETLNYQDDIYVPGTADTGLFSKTLNISKEDYLITGLLVFFVFGIVAFGIVVRGGKKSGSHKKKK